jgi:spore coat protein CotH
MTSHLDSYIGDFSQNYYIWRDSKSDEWRFLPWDLNMALGGFPKSCTDQGYIDFLIGDVTTEPMESRPLVALLDFPCFIY